MDFWSRYIAEAMELFLGDTGVTFASHHWPRLDGRSQE